MTITILAVDDSRTMRDLIRAALPDDTFSVDLAEDGLAGLDALKSGVPDVILTDINMPNLDGFGFIDAVRRQDATRTTPIIVLTTESAPAMRERAKVAGATGWIVKPFVADTLVRALRMVAG